MTQFIFVERWKKQFKWVIIFVIRKGEKYPDLNLFVAVFVNYDNVLP